MSDYIAIQELLTRDIKLKTRVEQLAEPLLWQLICKDAGKKQDVFYSYVQFYNPSMLL